MCNLYSITKSQDAIGQLFKVDNDLTGNLPSLPGVFPDYAAPIIRLNSAGQRTLEMMRWGFPPNQFVDKPTLITNVRYTEKKYWQPWLTEAHRCLVPVSSFCEYHDAGKLPHWFALDDERSPFAFAGIWCPWNGTRGTKKDPVEGDHLLFSFLTTDANDLVGPVHKKAMPVMLTTDEEWNTWLTAPKAEALALQRPFPTERMKIVATGKRTDSAEAA